MHSFLRYSEKIGISGDFSRRRDSLMRRKKRTTAFVRPTSTSKVHLRDRLYSATQPCFGVSPTQALLLVGARSHQLDQAETTACRNRRAWHAVMVLRTECETNSQCPVSYTCLLFSIGHMPLSESHSPWQPLLLGQMAMTVFTKYSLV